jgi:hypothetical protein
LLRGYTTYLPWAGREPPDLSGSLLVIGSPDNEVYQTTEKGEEVLRQYGYL